MKTIKLLIILLSLCSTITGSAQNIYPIQFKDIANADIFMTAYQGKKLLVTEFNGAAPDSVFLKRLDSIYLGYNDSLVIIAIPVRDFGSSFSVSRLDSFLQQLDLHYVISAVSYAKKEAGGNQHPLLKWVTDKTLNKHRDADIRQEGDVFIFNRAGRLYAGAGKNVLPTNNDIKKILNREPVQ